VQQAPLLVAPLTTSLGALFTYVTSSERKTFQPMNTNYGLFPPLARRLRGREKKAALAQRAIQDLAAWQTTHGLTDAAPAPSSTDAMPDALPPA
jgi:methylenetetrahydrofolate--tRNA-(uracil-5-)-methyltransferase